MDITAQRQQTFEIRVVTGTGMAAGGGAIGLLARDLSRVNANRAHTLGRLGDTAAIREMAAAAAHKSGFHQAVSLGGVALALAGVGLLASTFMTRGN